jgi:hypothetical protein
MTLLTSLSGFVAPVIARSSHAATAYSGSIKMLSAATMDYSALASGSNLVTSLANAWSVSGADLNSADFASSLFASSLFPYLGLLFFLSRKPTNTPPLANFGFQFLLFFVFATIPAGIVAKAQYGTILANVDWLHGTAESMLTVTNLLIIFGFRSVRSSCSSSSSGGGGGGDNDGVDAGKRGVDPSLFLLPIAVTTRLLSEPSLSVEPSNALSLPTWFVHTSSVLEWLVAMRLVWEHAEVSGNPRWKGLALAMTPSQASGLCACTYHIFYNSPFLGSIVSLQAALTLLGNTTMGFAAYRIFAYARQKEKEERRGQGGGEAEYDEKPRGLVEIQQALFNKYESMEPVQGRVNLSWIETVFGAKDSPARQEQRRSIALNAVPNKKDDFSFSIDLVLKAAGLAPIIKFGELLFLPAFLDGEHAGALPLALIFGPTALNAVQYLDLGQQEE